MKTRNILLPGLALLGAALLPLAAHAQGAFRHYPDHGNISQRLHTQNRRIQQGVENGTLTPREAAHLRFRDQGIRLQADRERAFHGGRLTRAERFHLNNRLSRDSGAIYRHRHDIGTH